VLRPSTPYNAQDRTSARIVQAKPYENAFVLPLPTETDSARNSKILNNGDACRLQSWSSATSRGPCADRAFELLFEPGVPHWFGLSARIRTANIRAPRLPDMGIELFGSAQSVPSQKGARSCRRVGDVAGEVGVRRAVVRCARCFPERARSVRRDAVAPRDGRTMPILVKSTWRTGSFCLVDHKIYVEQGATLCRNSCASSPRLPTK
jgi:hypothetical protein